MDTLSSFFGYGEHLTALQMSVRAFSMFFITLVLIRLAGMRTFAKKSSFDNILVIMLGAILARGVIGASPYWSTVAAAAVMVALHRIIALLSVKNRTIEKWVKGTHIKLYQDGQLIDNNLKKTGMSKNDLHESLRLETKKMTLSEIDTAFMETNGRISFILKDKKEKSA